MTTALAAEWKERRRNDPSIIGVEGKKLEVAQKAKKEAEKKRKQEEKDAQKRKKAKGNKLQHQSSLLGGVVAEIV